MATADDDVPALLQFAERYQRQDAPAADAAVTPSRETQKPAPRPVQPRETSSQESNWRSCKDAAREEARWSNSKPLFNHCSGS
ncbi:hypothetical protein M8494_07720 [Serratia ureilytica]